MKICPLCKKEFKGRNKFCSKDCSHKWRSDLMKQNNPMRDNVGCKHPFYNSKMVLCDNCKKEFYRSGSLVKNNNFCCRECWYKWFKNNFKSEDSPNYGRKGINHPSYKLDKPDNERQGKRLIEGYSDFVKDVMERDNYACKSCGSRGGYLNVHHLNSYHWDKVNRINVNNGITLCKECHKNFHKIYGRKYNTKEQFEEWINNKLQNAS